MVDLDSKLLLTELYPKLHDELRFLRAEVQTAMAGKTENLDNYIGQLARLIRVQAFKHKCSLFTAAVRVCEKSEFLEIPTIVAIAAAIEMTVETQESLPLDKDD